MLNELERPEGMEIDGSKGLEQQETATPEQCEMMDALNAEVPSEAELAEQREMDGDETLGVMTGSRHYRYPDKNAVHRLYGHTAKAEQVFKELEKQQEELDRVRMNAERQEMDENEEMLGYSSNYYKTFAAYALADGNRIAYENNMRKAAEQAVKEQS